MLYILIYFTFINVVSACLMYKDKKYAINKAFRIPESNLLFLCLFGGFFGTYIIMKYTKHKTKNWKFHLAVVFSFLFWVFILPLIIYFVLYS
ncbi:DUF1294 domain-containing protein [Otariodibacter sp.]|uniref:DUF1294 domain-containing protein n=1 Tax=Otariodibacter sp. TaxID=3030919 RepID=UPI0026098F24|nr:DUF1294 domain-containing protein [Otariodibacter sp.]